MYELKEQERRDIEELESENEKSERPLSELEAAKRTIPRLERAVRVNETSRDPIRGMAERECSSGSKESTKPNNRPEMRSPTGKKGKGKYNFCKLCCIMI